MVNHEAPESRPDDAGESEHCHHNSRPLGSFPWSKQIPYGSYSRGHQNPAADPLNSAVSDHLKDVGRQSRQESPDYENNNPGKQERFSSINVGQLADKHGGDSGGEHVDGDDPGVMLNSSQHRNNTRHRGAHNRLIDCREKHGCH
ncbi:hypothetical protein D3C74_384100 [compost metagenome]